MARKAAYADTDLVTIAEARKAAQEATAFLQERVDTLTAQLEDAERAYEQLRRDFDAQETEAYAIAEMVNDLDHALAFGHMDRVADVLASNPYAMLHRNMLHVSLTLN